VPPLSVLCSLTPDDFYRKRRLQARLERSELDSDDPDGCAALLPQTVVLDFVVEVNAEDIVPEEPRRCWEF
jgi:hypothetical protein